MKHWKITPDLELLPVMIYYPELNRHRFGLGLITPAGELRLCGASEHEQHGPYVPIGDLAAVRETIQGGQWQGKILATWPIAPVEAVNEHPRVLHSNYEKDD